MDTPVLFPLARYPRGGVVPQIDQKPQVGRLETPTVVQSLDTSFDTARYERLRLVSTLVSRTTRELEEIQYYVRLASWSNQRCRMVVCQLE